MNLSKQAYIHTKILSRKKHIYLRREKILQNKQEKQISGSVILKMLKNSKKSNYQNVNYFNELNSRIIIIILMKITSEVMYSISLRNENLIPDKL